MFRTMLKSKDHRVTVTQADLHYVGSVTIDADLMDAADLLEGEQGTIVDIDNGARLVTDGNHGCGRAFRASWRSGDPARVRPNGRRRGAQLPAQGRLRRRREPGDRSG